MVGLYIIPLLTNCNNWQVNVVKGLKMYEDIFTGSELSKLNDFVNELRAAGQNGELSGLYFSTPPPKKKRKKIFSKSCLIILLIAWFWCKGGNIVLKLKCPE